MLLNVKSYSVLIGIAAASLMSIGCQPRQYNDNSTANMPCAVILLPVRSFTIKYDFARFGKCTAAGRMSQSFTSAYYRFDKGEAQNVELQQGQKASINVPAGAKVMEIWFKNYTLSSPNTPPICEAYDSDSSKNYQFAVLSESK